MENKTLSKRRKFWYYICIFISTIILINLYCLKYPVLPCLRYELKISNTGNGTTIPNQDTIISVDSGAATEIQAIPLEGYRLQQWTVISGTPVIENSFSLATSVVLHNGDATIQANFDSSKIYQLSVILDTLNFIEHYYKEPPIRGVRFNFAPTTTRKCTLHINNIGPSYFKYIDYFGSDPTFSILQDSISGSNHLSIPFAVDSGNKYYFIVRPGNDSLLKRAFSTQLKNGTLTYRLTIDTIGKGTTDPIPGTTIIINSGPDTTIRAIPFSGNKLDRWIASPSANIEDSASLETKVELLNSNTIVIAIFKSGELHSLSEAIDTFNFTTHYYEMTPGSGVRLFFTSSERRRCTLTVHGTGEPYSAIFDYYGADSSYAKILQSFPGTLPLSISFNADSGNSYYFKVRPGSDTLFKRNFTTQVYGTREYELTMDINGSGTTNPLPGDTMVVDSGDTTIILAIPYSANKLDYWTVIDGIADFINFDSISLETFVILNHGNATIQANFINGEIYELKLDTTAMYNFIEHYFEVSPKNGVRFAFTPSLNKSCTLFIENKGDKKYSINLDYFETDSTYTTLKVSDSGNNLFSMPFAVDERNKYHFIVRPSHDSLFKSNFTTYIKYSNLIAYYPFNRNANDESGNNNHGTLNGVYLTEDRNKDSLAYYFYEQYPSYIYIDVGNNSSLVADNFKLGYTISAWIYIDQYNDNNVIIEKGNHVFSLRLFDGYRIEARHSMTDTTCFLRTADSTILSNTWYHIVTTWSELTTEWKIYVNNTLNTSSKINYLLPSVADGDMCIGKEIKNNDGYFNGRIDDVYIYNRALTEKEIKALYLRDRH